MTISSNGYVEIGTSSSPTHTYDNNILTVKNPDGLTGTGLKILSGTNNTNAMLSCWETEDSWGYRFGY